MIQVNHPGESKQIKVHGSSLVGSLMFSGGKSCSTGLRLPPALPLAGLCLGDMPSVVVIFPAVRRGESSSIHILVCCLLRRTLLYFAMENAHVH